MAKGRVDIRVMKHTQKARLRFYNAYPDSVEIILAALELARHETGSLYDTVALEAICMHFLSSYPVTNPIAQELSDEV